MRAKRFLGAVAALAFSIGVAEAQAWPTRPIKLMLPASAGGTSDILARVLGEKLKASIGQPIVMEHRPGAAGRVAAEAAARAEPDGYTFFMTSSAPHGIVPAMSRRLGYDPVGSFTPVARLVTTPNVLYVRPSLPVRTVGELVALAKREPGKLNFGSTGFGTTTYLSAVLLSLKAGMEVTHVPYKGASEVLVGIMNGTVDAAFENLPAVKPQIEAGNVRALAVTSRERSPDLPSLPTMAEAGLPDVRTSTWFGLLAPAGTPAAIVDRMAQAAEAALSDPALAAQLRTQLGAEPAYLPGPAFQDFFKGEIAAWTAVVEAAGIPRE